MRATGSSVYNPVIPIWRSPLGCVVHLIHVSTQPDGEHIGTHVFLALSLADDDVAEQAVEQISWVQVGEHQCPAHVHATNRRLARGDGAVQGAEAI